LKEHGVEGPFSIIHPGSGTYSVARRWPAEHFATLGRSLATELNHPIVVVGGRDEWDLGQAVVQAMSGKAVNICGQTDFATLVGILRQASLFVGNNAGVAQIASFLGTPTIVIFGPTSPQTWHVPSETSRAVRLDIACSPCFYRDRELGTPEGCATRECLVGLSPQRVLAEALALMRETRAT
jgi:ADP-heptose:LPS heptosyltransferase